MSNFIENIVQFTYYFFFINEYLSTLIICFNNETKIWKKKIRRYFSQFDLYLFFDTKKKIVFENQILIFSIFFVIFKFWLFFLDRVDSRIFKVIVLITYVIWYSRIISTTKFRTQFVEYRSFDEKNNNENEKIFRNDDTNKKCSTTKSINIKRIFVNNVTRKFD